jgi:hypothetical protein
MAEAEVGDDNSREDPTVRRLEALVAERFDREAALFVPSGTMGNLVSILAHPNHGDEIVVGDAAHTFIYEAQSRLWACAPARDVPGFRVSIGNVACRAAPGDVRKGGVARPLRTRCIHQSARGSSRSMAAIAAASAASGLGCTRPAMRSV